MFILLSMSATLAKAARTKQSAGMHKRSHLSIRRRTVRVGRSAFSALLLVLLIPLATVAQGAPATSAPDATELTTLLQDFLAGASRNDAAMHDRFWAEDLIYTTSSGKRIGKADILHDVRAEASAPPGDEKTIYSAEEIRIQQYGTTAIVAFHLIGTTTKGGKTEVANYLNTGTFLKREGKWQAVSWQATKVPVESAAKK